jgi:hypothetical protein
MVIYFLASNEDTNNTILTRLKMDLAYDNWICLNCFNYKEIAPKRQAKNTFFLTISTVASGEISPLLRELSLLKIQFKGRLF